MSNTDVNAYCRTITQWAHIMFASRATDLIVAGCRHASGTVLLPALFCADVTDAIERAGLKYRCYDVPKDLSCPSREIHYAMGRDIGTIIILHPFGLCRIPDGLTDRKGVVVLEDACFALRTAALDSRVGSIGDLTVFSLRKEFDWLEGGLARGPLSRALKIPAPLDSAFEQQWRNIDVDSLVCAGLSTTQLARQRLGDRLPFVSDREVLTMLPLKSPRRDSVIERLRRKGIPAWRWIRRLKRMGPASTPEAWLLRSKLLLVPLPVEANIERTLNILVQENLQPWSD